MVSNKIESIGSYISKKNVDNEKQEIAITKGFETYEDYQFAIAKSCMSDCSFSLAKDYYRRYEKYLLGMLKSFLGYLNTGNTVLVTKDNKRYELTNYSLNELVNALVQGNKTLLDFLKEKNVSIESIITLIAQTNLNNDKTSDFSFKLQKEN